MSEAVRDVIPADVLRNVSDPRWRERYGHGHRSCCNPDTCRSWADCDGPCPVPASTEGKDAPE